MSDQRNSNGRFSQGNSGGPGRPRRPIEREYLGALLGAVSLDDWHAIVTKAVEDAKSGDAKARDWLARFVLGASPMKAVQLAADEKAGFSPEMEIETTCKDREQSRALSLLCDGFLDDATAAIK